MKNLHKSIKSCIFVTFLLFAFYGLPRIYGRVFPYGWDMVAWFVTALPLILVFKNVGR